MTTLSINVPKEDTDDVWDGRTKYPSFGSPRVDIGSPRMESPATYVPTLPV